MDAWEKFREQVRRYALITPGDRIVVAVSGGPDSVCLLHVLWRLQKTMPLTLVVVHCDHGLRKEAARESRRVVLLGEKLGIETVVRAVPVRAYARNRRLSVETAGRDLRYAAMAAVAREYRCSLIATGHTANDNAETMLMWLLRGTGTDGLAGIPVQRPGEGAVRVIRPILSVTRAEVLAYVRRQRLSCSIDRSNFSLDYTRNRIRHTVMPLLRKHNSCLVEHLYALSRIQAQENEFLGALTRNALRRCARVGENEITLDLKLFLRYNTVIQLRVLKQVLPEKKSRVHIERFLWWLISGSAGGLSFSRRWQVARTSTRLIMTRHKDHV